MAIAPKHYRAARLAIPRLPLLAIFGFAFFGVGGSVFLSFTTFSHSDAKHFAAASNDVPVYEARAVPFDAVRKDTAPQPASVAQALTTTPAEVPHTSQSNRDNPDRAEKSSEPTLFADSNRPLRGFPGFSDFSASGIYVAAGGISSGMSAQEAPSGFFAPDAETMTSAPVPEASTWLCGGVLFLLVAARGARAHLHRKRRRDS